MKKILVIFLVLLMSAGAVFAQQRAPAGGAAAAAKARKNAISLDMYQLLRGFIASDSGTFFVNMSLNYERYLASHFSLGGQFDLAPGKIGMFGQNVSYFYFGANVFTRYYPLSDSFEKFFMGFGLGVNLQAVDGKTGAAEGGFVGLTTSLKMGYKVVTRIGLYIEPSLAFVLSKNNSASSLSSLSSLGFLGALFGGDFGGDFGGGGGSFATIVPLGWQGGFRFGFAF